ncbi:hypothetical protein BaRGS_00002118 [Batillaria attramentaria]|uniref:Uncharacterized protein n=1 Tax=Batillaria attramentaria TaxID=370345 RepID=A0ABD0M642_9CAEN
MLTETFRVVEHPERERASSVALAKGYLGIHGGHIGRLGARQAPSRAAVQCGAWPPHSLLLPDTGAVWTSF